jgi:hypothetical protein
MPFSEKTFITALMSDVWNEFLVKFVTAIFSLFRMISIVVSNSDLSENMKFQSDRLIFLAVTIVASFRLSALLGGSGFQVPLVYPKNRQWSIDKSINGKRISGFGRLKSLLLYEWPWSV